MPEQPATLAAALAALQAALPRIGKDAAAIVQGESKQGKSFTYGYKYADLPALTRAVMPLLASHGLAFTACPTMTEIGGKPMFVLRYMLLHESGEQVSGDYPLASGTPQAMGGQITYARRYALCAVTGVAPDEDDDDAAEAEAQAREMRRLPPEVDVHGAATFAEQTRMVSGREPGATRARATAGEDSQWQAAPDPAADPRTGGLRAMFALYKELGVEDKDEMLADLSEILGKPVGSRSDLDLSEVSAVNVVLRRRRDAARRDRSAARAEAAT